MRPAALATAALLGWGCAAEPDPAASRRPAASEWPHYGNDAGGQRFAVLDALEPANVSQLEPAWTFHSGDVSDGQGEVASTSAFEATPILVDGLLYVCSPFNRVFALDPQTGAAVWSFDPQIDLTGRYANQLVCRGVAHWRDASADAASACSSRIFSATNDGRLFAIDAATGRPCSGFGDAGSVDLTRGVGEIHWRGEYQVTSPPAVIGNRVVVGSAVSDNNRIRAPSGVVRAFDAVSGAQLWAWDLAPPDFAANSENTSDAGFALGTPNVWAPISVDGARDLVFLPTGNAAPDFFRGERAHMNHYGSSVVAVRGSSGEPVWRFQTVHRDLWDYDVPAQPLLTTLPRGGEEVPVVVQATKMGLVFVLHRETGEPVFPVTERPVPQGGAPGERLAPTQPFPERPPPLVPHRLGPERVWGLTPWDRGRCREMLASSRNEGIYTPPGLDWSIAYPGNGGGVNWGGAAVHPQRRLLVTNTMDIPWRLRLLRRDDLEAEREAHPGADFGPQHGTPYAIQRSLLLSPLGLPCNPPPWGTLVAVDLDAGEIAWQVPLGTVRDIAPVPLPVRLGVPGLGGPLVTSGGLVLIAAAMDDYLRAFDLASGEELWKGRLPAGGQATPMAYEIDGRPYVVIAAGGHARAGTRLGDSLVAFALPD